MTEAEEIISLKKKLEDQRIQYYRVFDELNTLKRTAARNSRGWYLEYTQSALMTIERQYAQLQEDYHALNAKHNHEMAKRQYVFPNNPSKNSKVEDHFDHIESEQI